MRLPFGFRVRGIRSIESMRRITYIVVSVWFAYTAGYMAFTGERFFAFAGMATIYVVINVIDLGERIARAIERKPHMMIGGGITIDGGGLTIEGDGASLTGLHIEHTGTYGVSIAPRQVP